MIINLNININMLQCDFILLYSQFKLIFHYCRLYYASKFLHYSFNKKAIVRSNKQKIKKNHKSDPKN